MKNLFYSQITIMYLAMISLLILIIDVNFTVSSQSDDNVLPENIADLVYAVGNRDSDTVIVNAQGGPIPELETHFFEFVFSFVDLEQYYLINAHQVQTINPIDFMEHEVTFEEAKIAAAESTQMLADIVQYFKSEGKKVYVVGLSYGAFIVTDFIATYGNIADGYLIMIGRLDMPDEVWTVFAEGRMVGFVDGVEIAPVDAEAAGMGGEGEFVDANMARLAAGLGYKRFTALLEGADLSNVIYGYSHFDEQVGRLTSEEIDFLLRTGAVVIGLPTDHGGAIEEFLSSAFLLLVD